MKGQATINGADLYTEYGAMLKKGTYQALMAAPKVKAVLENKSRLKDGTDITVLTFGSRRRYEDREVSVTFIVKGDDYSELITNYEKLNSVISSDLFNFAVKALNQTFRLLMVEQTSFELYRKERLIAVTYKLREPNPANRANE